MYPNKLTGGGTAVVQPPGRLDELRENTAEPVEPLLQPHHPARARRLPRRGRLHGQPRLRRDQPDRHEPGPRRDARAGGPRAADGERGRHSERAGPPPVPAVRRRARASPPTSGPDGIDVEARSNYNAGFVTVNKRFSHGLQVGCVLHLSQLDEQQRRVARRGRNGARLLASGRRTTSTTTRSGASVQFDRTHRFVTNYIWEMPGPEVRRPEADPRRLAGLGCDAVPVRAAVHDRHRRRLERRRQHRLRSSQHQPAAAPSSGTRTARASPTTATTPCRWAPTTCRWPTRSATATRPATASAARPSGRPT